MTRQLTSAGKTILVGFMGFFAIGLMIANPGRSLAADDLAQAAANAKKSFQAISAEQVATAKASLVAALGTLERKLSRNPADVRDGWHEFLMTGDLNEQLRATEPSLEKLQPIWAKFSSDKEGMEWAPVLAARQALRDYVELLEASQNAKLAEEYGARLDDLEKRLAALRDKPTTEDAVAVGRTIGWLRRNRQAPALVDGIAGSFSQANLVVRASKKLVGTGIESDVDETTQISDSVLGASIFGTVRMTGKVSLALAPSDERAELNLLLSGVAASNNVGHKGPVTIHSTGATSISASKRLWIDADGLHSDGAEAACATNSHIHGISANCRLIEKMAWKKAGQSKGQAEAIASRRAEGRVASRVDDQASEMLADANGKFNDKFRKPLVRRGGFPQRLQFHTTAENLFVRMMQRGADQLAAPAEAPAINGTPDLAVRLHESMVGNFSEAALGGVKLTDEKLADMLKDATGEVPEELQIGPDKDPWSITFSDQLPISVSLKPDGVTIAIQGRRFTRGDQEIRNAMRIVATYKFERTKEGAKLIRQGDVDVDYINVKGSQSISQVTFKTFLRRKFESLMKAEIVSDGIKLPGRWEKGGKLVLDEMQVTPGWLSLTWNLAPSAAPSPAATAAVETP